MFGDLDTHDGLCRTLAAENIVTSCRDDNLRASFHFYNCEQDVEALLRGLTRHRAQFQ